MALMAAGPTSPANKAPPPPATPTRLTYPILAAKALARDTTVAWLRGEFAAANAIIDALCGHLAELGGGAGQSEYASVFTAIHRRRLNWLPVLHMQEFYSIADVAAELKRAASWRAATAEEESVEVEGRSVGVWKSVKESERLEREKKGFSEEATESDGNGGGNGDFKIVDIEDDSPATASDVTDSGSYLAHALSFVFVCGL